MSEPYKVKYLCPTLNSGRAFGKYAEQTIAMINKALDAGTKEIHLEIYPAEELNEANKQIAQLKEKLRSADVVISFYASRDNWRWKFGDSSKTENIIHPTDVSFEIDKDGIGGKRARQWISENKDQLNDTK